MDLVERDSELAMLREHLDRVALDGQSAASVVAGVAGIGKTSLLRVIVGEAEALGLEVAWAGGRETKSAPVLGLLEQLLMPLAARYRDDLEATPVGRSAIRLLGFDDGPTESGDVDVGRLVVATQQLLELVTAQQPVVLVADDLQWVDQLSLDVLAGTIERWDDEVPVLFLLGLRDGERTQPLMDRLQVAGATVVRPRPLSAAAIRELLEGRGQAIDDHAADDLRDRSGGVPLLVVEHTRSPESSGEGRGGAISVASTVRQRMGGLPDADTLALRMLALLDVPDRATLARATGLPETDLGRTIARLHAAQLVDADGRFEHALIRDAVRQSIPTASLGLLHARAARALLAVGDERAAAAHALTATPQGDPEIVDALWAEARRARHHAGRGEEIRLLTRALDEPPPADRTYELLMDLARAQSVVADFAAVLGTVQRARAVAGDDIDRLVEVTSLESAALASSGDPLAGMSMLRALLAEHGGELSPKQRLEAESSLATVAMYAPEFGGWTPDELTEPELAERIDPRDAAATLVPRSRYAYLARLPRDVVIDLSRRGCAAAGLQDGDPVAAYQQAQGVVVLATAGEPAEAIAFVTPLIQTTRESGAIRALEMLLYARAQAHFIVGDLWRCEEDLGEIDDLLRSEPRPTVQRTQGLLLAQCLCEQGRLDEADAALAALPDDPQDPPARLLHAEGMLRLAQADHQRAVAALSELRDRERADPTLEVPHRPWRPGLALALAGAGHVDEALSVAEEHLSFASWWDAPATLGEARRVIAEISGDAALLERAIADLDEERAPLELAKCLFALGRMRRRAGQRSSAPAAFADAARIGYACGARGLISAAGGELAVLRSRPQALAFSGLESLTASERRVARLAADGFSTKHIAHMLYVSRRTVENHLGRVYQKLDIAGRDGLADVLGHEVAGFEDSRRA